MLQAASVALGAVPGWECEEIHSALVELASSLGVKNATLMWPVRISVTGKAVSPGGAIEICWILGREETLRRISAGIEKLGG